MFKNSYLKNTFQFVKFSQAINKYIWICTILAAVLMFVSYCYFGLYLLEIEKILDYEKVRPIPLLVFFSAAMPTYALIASLKTAVFILALGYILNIIIFKHQKFNLLFILSIIIFAKGMVEYSQQSAHAIDILKTKFTTYRIANFKNPNEIQSYFVDYQKKHSARYQKQVLYAITRNPNTSSQTLNDISKISNSELYEETIVYFLNGLRVCRRFTVMHGVARHPHTPLSILEELSKNKYTNLDLLQEIVKNPNISKELMSQLSEEYGREINGSIAESITTPPEYLEKLADYYKKDQVSAWIKVRLCQNPNITIRALELMSHDGDVKELQALIQIQKTESMLVPPDILLLLYFYDYSQYKTALRVNRDKRMVSNLPSW